MDASHKRKMFIPQYYSYFSIKTQACEKGTFSLAGGKKIFCGNEAKGLETLHTPR